MSSRVFMLLLFAVLLIDSAYTACPTNWTVLNRDCCSPTFGFNSTVPTFHLAQGVDYPAAFTVWNDSSTSSVSVDTDWGTLNVFWGQRTGSRSMPYAPDGLVDIVRIFYQSGKGLYGLQFHDSSGFGPVLGMATITHVDLELGGRPFSGWGVITHQFELLQSLGTCFRME